MSSFSESSKQKLSECHPHLQRLFEEVIKHYDCTILCGHRSKDEQDQAFTLGTSKVTWPNSKHNKKPSLAVDVMPYPVNWKDNIRTYHFVGFVLGVAKTLGIKVRSGADWDGDMDFKDQNFFDLPHWELIEETE